MRDNIEAYVRRALRRELRYLGSALVTVAATPPGGAAAYRCRLRLWSPDLGLIVVAESGSTVRAATQQAAARARHVVRRRVKKRLSRLRRIKIHRLGRWLTDSAHD